MLPGIQSARLYVTPTQAPCTRTLTNKHINTAASTGSLHHQNRNNTHEVHYSASLWWSRGYGSRRNTQIICRFAHLHTSLTGFQTRIHTHSHTRTHAYTLFHARMNAPTKAYAWHIDPFMVSCVNSFAGQNVFHRV